MYPKPDRATKSMAASDEHTHIFAARSRFFHEKISAYAIRADGRC